MQRIKIYEKDNTTTSLASSVTRGSVLILGFAKGGDAEQGVPIECTNKSLFTTAFGTSAPTFDKDNYYPYKNTPEATVILSGESPDTLAEKYNADETTLKIKNATDFKEASAYSVNDKCFKVLSTEAVAFYQCKVAKKAGAAWDDSSWDLLLVLDTIIKVEKDSRKSGATGYYKFTCTPATTTTETSAVFVELEESLEGFPKVAIPVDSDTDAADDGYSTCVMFKSGLKDPSWVMAYSLVCLGLPVTYVKMNATESDITVKLAYSYLYNFFNTAVTENNDILDKGSFNIQFITSGGYPVLEYSTGIASAMLSVAKPNADDAGGGRGDCLVLLDHTNNPHRPLTGVNSVFESGAITESSYSAVFTPWCNVGLNDLGCVPASFIYLYNIASNLSSGNTWNIYAGIGNGRSNIITSLNTDHTLTNKIAEYYLNDFGVSSNPHCSMNAITYIRNYGYCIWGNRVCELYQMGQVGFALSFVNIRNLVSEVKKRAFFTSQQLMFEINNDSLWVKFKNNMSILLEQMKSGGGIEDYALVKNDNEEQTKLDVAIILYPAYGVEAIDITVQLEDNTTTVTETA